MNNRIRHIYEYLTRKEMLKANFYIELYKKPV